MNQALKLLLLWIVAGTVIGFCFHVGWDSVDSIRRLVIPQSQCAAELQLSKSYAQQLETMLDEKQPDLFEALAGK